MGWDRIQIACKTHIASLGCWSLFCWRFSWRDHARSQCNAKRSQDCQKLHCWNLHAGEWKSSNCFGTYSQLFICNNEHIKALPTASHQRMVAIPASRRSKPHGRKRSNRKSRSGNSPDDLRRVWKIPCWSGPWGARSTGKAKSPRYLLCMVHDATQIHSIPHLCSVISKFINFVWFWLMFFDQNWVWMYRVRI